MIRQKFLGRTLEIQARIALILSCLASVAIPALGQGTAANRINGVAEFLLDRANENAVIVLQQDMKGNRLLRCYLPETYKSATSSNLQMLLQSGPDLWRRSVETDLKNFGVQLLLNGISSDTLKASLERMDTSYIAALRRVKIKIGDKEYPVTEIPYPKPPAEVVAAINSFYDPYTNARSSLAVIVANLANEQNLSAMDCPASSFTVVLRSVEDAIEGLRGQMPRFQNADVIWRGEAGSSSDPAGEFFNSFSSIVEVAGRMKYYQGQIDAIRKEASLVVQTYKLEQLIHESIESNENPLISRSKIKDFEKFSRYALNLAMLSEAQSATQTKSIMRQLALPSASFSTKREQGAKKLMITAYFGGAGGVEFSGNTKGYGGLTVPVGFEYSRGFAKGSASFMLSPLDFGHPVNQNINGGGNAPIFKDILSPGAYLMYGFKTVPVSMGMGCSYGPSLTSSDRRSRGRCFALLATDMPLFSFY